MRKIILWEILFILLILLIVGALWIRKPAADIPLSKVEEALSGWFEKEEMEAFKDMTLRRNFSLDAVDFREYLYYGQSDTMAVQTFLLVKCHSEKETERVLEAVQAYLKRELKAFEGYGARQTALLKDARIYENGPYAAFIVSSEADEIESRLKSVLEE